MGSGSKKPPPSLLHRRRQRLLPRPPTRQEERPQDERAAKFASFPPFPPAFAEGGSCKTRPGPGGGDIARPRLFRLGNGGVRLALRASLAVHLQTCSLGRVEPDLGDREQCEMGMRRRERRTVARRPAYSEVAVVGVDVDDRS